MEARNDVQTRKVKLRMKDKKRWPMALALVLVLAVALVGCGVPYGSSQQQGATEVSPAFSLPTVGEDSSVVTTPAPQGESHYSVETAATLPNTGTKKALSTIEIYKTASPSVVAISTAGTTTTMDFFGQQRQVEVESAGSGVIISKDGYILTCNHVVEGMDEVVVVMADGEEHTAKVIGGDSATDLAVLKIDLNNLTPVILGDSDQLQIGELAVAIGNPLGLYSQPSQTSGIISGKERVLVVEGNNGSGVEMMNLLQHDAAINPGNSGGGLFNSYGELVGITSAKSAGTAIEGMGFAIPINDAKTIINDLVNYGYVVRPQIGISGVSINEEDAKAYSMPAGVFVAEVVEGGAADKAGIVKGDVITKVDGDAITSIEELTRLKNSKKVGDTMKLTVVHGEDTKEMTITLTQEVKATPTPSPTPSSNANLPENLPPIFEDFFR